MSRLILSFHRSHSDRRGEKVGISRRGRDSEGSVGGGGNLSLVFAGPMPSSIMDLMPTDSSEAHDLQSEIELCISLLREAIAGGALDNIERCTLIAEATRERVNIVLSVGKTGPRTRSVDSGTAEAPNIALSEVDCENTGPFAT